MNPKKELLWVLRVASKPQHRSFGFLLRHAEVHALTGGLMTLECCNAAETAHSCHRERSGLPFASDSMFPSAAARQIQSNSFIGYLAELGG